MPAGPPTGGPSDSWEVSCGTQAPGFKPNTPQIGPQCSSALEHFPVDPQSLANATLCSEYVKTAGTFPTQDRTVPLPALSPSSALHGRQPRGAAQVMDVLAEKWEDDFLFYLCLVPSLAYSRYPNKFLLNELRTGCYKNKGVGSKQVSNMLCSNHPKQLTSPPHTKKPYPL